MDNRIFRKASIDRVNSPDRVDDCLQIPNASPWLIIVGLLLLLFGMGVWTMFSHSEQRLPAIVKVEDGVGYCIVDGESVRAAQSSAVVELEGRSIPVMLFPNADGDKATLTASFDVTLEDGLYNGELVVHIKPIDDPTFLIRNWRFDV